MLSYLLAALESEEDKRRFTELYEENHVRAEQTALRILRDPHDAEDAVQNAFLQVIHHFDEISEIPCKKLGFWIISILQDAFVIAYGFGKAGQRHSFPSDRFEPRFLHSYRRTSSAAGRSRGFPVIGP